jgi:hypothetical protein
VAELADHGTRRLVNTILVEEENHIDWIRSPAETNCADGHPVVSLVASEGIMSAIN